MQKKLLKKIFSDIKASVSPDTSASGTLKLMYSKKISCIVVLKNNIPVGIFTERDAVKVGASKRSLNLKIIPIRELMTSPVITANENMEVFAAYNLLVLHKIRHIVIVDENEQAKGIVTHSNLIEHLSYKYFIEMQNVSQIMTKEVCTITKNLNIHETMIKMAQKDISCLIVEQDKRPIGVVSERDITGILSQYPDKIHLAIENVMSRSVQSVQLDTPIHEAIHCMEKLKIRRMIVVDNEGKIKGLITQSDIIKGLEYKYIETLQKTISAKNITIEKTSKDLSQKTVYLDNILHSSIDYGIIATDINFRLLYYNPAAEQIIGHKSEDIIGTDARNITLKGTANLSPFAKMAETFKKDKRNILIFESNSRKNKKFIQLRITEIRDQGDSMTGFFFMASDITDKIRAEVELVKIHQGLEKKVRDRTQELKKAMEGIIHGMALMVEMRDPYTSGHQRRVADLAADIGREMFLPLQQIEGIHMAGLIHDVGKIRVPSDILSQPGKLTEPEFAILKPHPETGYDILKTIEFPWPVADIVHQHHEKIDGSGYPLGLKGKRILIEARILTVADVVEAMVSHRPYRPSLGTKEALNEINQGSGIIYDPKVVKVCVKLINNKKSIFKEN